MAFWLRSVRRRPAAAALLAVIAAVATVASVIAPLLLRALEQSTLDDSLAQAGYRETSLAAAATATGGGVVDAESAAVTATSSLSPHWRPGVVVAESDGRAQWTVEGPGGSGGSGSASGSSGASGSGGSGGSGGASGSAPFAGLAGGCRVLDLTGGRCPTARGDVLAADRSGLHVGDRVRVVISKPFEVSFTREVVGTYDPTTTGGRIVGGPGKSFGAGGDAEPDLVGTIDAFGQEGIEGLVWSVRTLAPGVDLDDVPALRSDVRALEAAKLTAESASSQVVVVQHLGRVLDAVEEQHRSAELVVAVIGIQALALAWCVEAVVIARVGRARSAEWGLARLRGLPRRRRLGTVLLEPGIPVLVGAVVGLALALPTARSGADLLLDRTIPLEPVRLPVVLAAVGAVLGSVVALLVASVRPATQPLVDLLRRTTEPRGLSRTGAVVQTVGVVAAAVVIVAIVTEQRISGPGVALLAPTLVAVLVGVAALRLAVPLVRRAADRRSARSAAGVFVVRRLARTPSALTTAVVVTIGVAIAVSSAQTAVYAVRLQRDQAAERLGGATVLDARVRSGVSFVDAVRAADRSAHDADPDGPRAMAAESYTTGTDVGRIVAVDLTHLPAAAWDASWRGRSLAEARRVLHPAGGPSLRVTGDRLTVTLADVGVPPSATVSTDPADLDLSVVVQNAGGWHTVDLGAPRDGALRGAVPCTSGCRVVMIALTRPIPDGSATALQATVTGIAASTGDGPRRQVSEDWLDPARWRDRIGESTSASDRPTTAVGARADGLLLVWSDPSGSGRAAAAPRDAPEPLPVLVGAATTTDPFPGVRRATLGIGLDGSSTLLRSVGRAPSLPRVLDQGVLVDLPTADLVSDPGQAIADHEVWLTPGDHARVVAELRDEGVTVTGVHTAADAERTAVRAAPTLGAVVGVAAGGAALLLTLLAVLAVGMVGAEAARTDVDVLRTAGFDRRRTRRLLLGEAFAPPAVAVLLGALAGSLATLLIAGRLPLRDGDAPPAGSPVDLTLTSGIVVVALLLLGVIALASAAAVARGRRTPGRRRPASADPWSRRGTAPDVGPRADTSPAERPEDPA